MPKDDLLLEAFKATRDRLEAELKLHWQRIQIATIGIVGLMTGAGWIIAQSDMPGEKQACLLFLSGVLGVVLCTYTFILATSGKEWIDINEQKVMAIEEELFKVSIYHQEKEIRRPLSLSKATNTLIVFLGVLFTAVMIVSMLKMWALSISRACGYIFSLLIPQHGCILTMFTMVAIVVIVFAITIVGCQCSKIGSRGDKRLLDERFVEALRKISRGCGA